MLNWEDGKVLEFHGFLYDCGDILITEPIIRRRENQPVEVHAVICMIEDALIILCRDGKISYGNAASAQLLSGTCIGSHKWVVRLQYSAAGRRDWVTVDED